MRFVLVGADYEENLGICMIAAAAEAAGHRTWVVPYCMEDEVDAAVASILAVRPDVVGISAQFQHRGVDFLRLACELRRAGFRGHLTAGGQFATMACAPILAGRYGIDSVVLYEGESTIAELLDAIATNKPLRDVAGLALPDDRGGVLRTAPRPLAKDLDRLPLAHRYRQHSRQFGVPFIPVSGSRGCWASCSFCSITTVLRDGRAHGVSGRRLRLRSPEDVGLEMAMLAHAVGDSAIFCFHDENFLLPRPADSLQRVAAIKKVLDEQGVAQAALVGKCRPDTVTKELARELAKLGVIRMYVGIENASPQGALHLHRGADVTTAAAALEAFTEAGIFACYNLLLFEPEATLDDIRANIAFMRAHAGTPINFCRAEPYLGTPMHTRLQAAGKLQGGFLGSDYRIEDDRTETLFRIASSIFRDHNFAAEGVANRTMGLGYSAKVLEIFYKSANGKVASFMERAHELTRSITLDTAAFFEEALDFAATVDLADHDAISRKTAQLGLRVAASDRLWHAAIDALERDMNGFARGEAEAKPRAARRVAKVAQEAAMAGWLALWATGAASCRSVMDPLPPDGGAKLDGKKDGPVTYDPLPPPADARKDFAVYDPPPPPTDARKDYAVYDPPPPPTDARKDYAVYDPPPPPSDARRDLGGYDEMPIDGGARDGRPDFPPIYDPLPPPTDARDSKFDSGRNDSGNDAPPFIVDPVVHASEGLRMPSVDQTALPDHWADTAPSRMKRSEDLALCLCPDLRLVGCWDGEAVRATVSGVDDDFTVRWQAQGSIEGDGREVIWRPSSDEDQLDVAVRTRDGVATTLLRHGHVRGSKRS
jgi:radical SAM superfamily enzyme YgiQ (UPF0313 family)